MYAANAVNVKGYTNDADEDDEDELSSVSLNNLMIAFRMFFWVLIVAVIAGVVIGAIVSAFLYEPVYSTSASFTIAGSRTGDEDYGFRSTLDDKLITAETYVITSSTLKNMVVDDLGEDYQSCSITADKIADTNVVTVNVTADSTAKAYAVLKEVIEDFPKVSKKIFGDVNITLIDEVAASDIPVNQGAKKKMIALGGIGGLLLGGIIIIMYSFSLNLVSDAETLQKYVNIECIGKAPMLPAKVVKQTNNVTIEGRNIPDDFKQIFQFIRTRTERYCKKHNCKVILITSTFPGEGKTTTSVNIALSLAQNKKSAIVIDCDLRNPSVVERFGAKRGKFGFDDYLRGKCSFDEATVRLPKSNVFFISCNRSMGSRASEMLGSKVMQEAVELAKTRADYVIIDSPPIDVMGDSITLSQYADTSIFVVKQNYGRLNNIIHAIESMKQSKAEPMGFVLNGSYGKMSFTEYSHYGYGYGNRYGYGYGSRYGYGKYSESSRKNEKKNS